METPDHSITDSNSIQWRRLVYNFRTTLETKNGGARSIKIPIKIESKCPKKSLIKCSLKTILYSRTTSQKFPIVNSNNTDFIF